MVFFSGNMCGYYMCSSWSWRPQEGIGSSDTAVTDSLEPPQGSRKPKTRSFAKAAGALNSQAISPTSNHTVLKTKGQ